MEITTTPRGFTKAQFTDLNQEKCSLQQSSLATEEAIWLGIDQPKLTVFEDASKGKYLVTPMPPNFAVSCRMHLTREQVAELLPLLQQFVATGELS